MVGTPTVAHSRDPLAFAHPTANTRYRPRGAKRPSHARKLSPFEIEGVGNAGRSMHPQPRMRIVVVKLHASIHSEAPEITRHSRTQWFTVYIALSSERSGSIASVALRINGCPTRLSRTNLRKT